MRHTTKKTKTKKLFVTRSIALLMAILGAWALLGCPDQDEDTLATSGGIAVTDLGFTDYTAISIVAGGTATQSPMWTTAPTGNITYSIADGNTALPNGIALDAGTGKISVDATAAVQATTEYTITATGDGTVYTGTAEVKIYITINKAGSSALTGTLSYAPTAITTTVGTAASAMATLTGLSSGASAVYGIAPSTTGISINPTTGEISVAASAAIAGTTPYTVTVTALDTHQGNVTAIVNITVNAKTLTSLNYAGGAITATVGTAITNSNPTVVPTGASVTYAITPALPAGLSLNATSGIIGGTPSAIATSKAYTITATGTGDYAGRTATATINITVNAIDITGKLSYDNIRGKIHSPITDAAPIWSEVEITVANYASTNLPDGLSINSGTGIVSGIPSTVGQASFTVTASGTGNYTGTASVTVNVDFESDQNPTLAGTLSYAPTVITTTVGTAASATATLTGLSSGASAVYGIAPSTTGISINPTTGEISVAASAAIAGTTPYTVTVTALDTHQGNVTAIVNITVNAKILTSLNYAGGAINATVGTAITNSNPTVVPTGASVTYAITPALPAGLSLNATSGIIGGTPSAIATSKAYTITATGTGDYAGRTATATINIGVVAKTLTSVNYAGGDIVATVNTAITNSNPTVVPTGASVTYTITAGGALPAGLSLNATSGIIGGTPSAIATSKAYTITATGTGDYAGRTATATINITVEAIDITSALSYSNITGTINSPIADAKPSWSVAGVTVANYASANLPAGLSINSSSGIVSGTPSMVGHASFTVTASGTGNYTGTASVTVNVDFASDQNPTLAGTLSYAPTAITTTVGTAASAMATLTGLSAGATAVYGKAPSTTGISINPTTGEISVAANAAIAGTTPYTVTVTALDTHQGNVTATVNITINAKTLTSLNYAGGAINATVGTAITNSNPTVVPTGASVTYAITAGGALPAGLSLNATSGIIGGTPSAIATSKAYTITATGTGDYAGRTATATINIGVVAKTLTSVNYAGGAINATVGTAITNSNPTVVPTGASVTYAITAGGALPAGLSLNATSGIIGGTPSAIATSKAYTITATGTGDYAGRTATATINIGVVAKTLTSVNYAGGDIVTIVGTAITNSNPTVVPTGASVSYAITPALPAGLTFDTTSGIIGGTPSAIATSKAYTITATGTGNYVGSTKTATISITVNAIPLTSVNYAGGDIVTTVGTAITNSNPTVVPTGASVTYAISPTLSAGLTFSTTSGIIGGTPSVVKAATTYTITATGTDNYVGSTKTAMISITVNAIPLTSVNYAGGDIVATVNTAITNSNPTVVPTGASVTYAITAGGVLPAGLTLNATSGIIGGTPSVVKAATTYTITATGTGNYVGSTKTATISITVNPVPAVTDVTIDIGTTASATFGDNPVTLTATVAVEGTPAPASTVTWSIVPPAPEVATVGLNSGVVTIVGAGTANIIATSTFDITKSATLALTVDPIPLTAGDVTLTGATSVSATAGTAATGLPSLTLNNGVTATFSIAPTDPAKDVGGVTISNGALAITTDTLGEADYTITATGTGNYTGTVTVPSTITVTSKYVLGTDNIPAIAAGDMINITANPLPKVGGGNLAGAHGLAGSIAEVYTVNTANNAFTFTEALLINGYKTGTFADTVTISGGRVAIGAIGVNGAAGMTIALNQNNIIQDSTQNYKLTVFGIQVKNTTDGNNGFAVLTSTGALGGTTLKNSNRGFTGGTNVTPVDRTSAAFTIENGRALVLGLAASGNTQISFTSMEILPVAPPIPLTAGDVTLTGATSVSATAGTAATGLPSLTLNNGVTATFSIAPTDPAKDVGGVTISNGALAITTDTLGIADYTITATGTGNYIGTVTVPSTITVTSKYVLGTDNIPAIAAGDMVGFFSNPLPLANGTGNLNGPHGLAGSTGQLYVPNRTGAAFAFTEALLITGYNLSAAYPDLVTVSGNRVEVGTIDQVGAAGMTIVLNQNNIIQDATQNYTLTVFGIQVKNTTDGNNGFAVLTSTGAGGVGNTTLKSSNLGFTGGTNVTPVDRTPPAFTIENGRALVLGLAASGGTQLSFTRIEIIPQ